LADVEQNPECRVLLIVLPWGNIVENGIEKYPVCRSGRKNILPAGKGGGFMDFITTPRSEVIITITHLGETVMSWYYGGFWGDLVSRLGNVFIFHLYQV